MAVRSSNYTFYLLIKKQLSKFTVQVKTLIIKQMLDTLLKLERKIIAEKIKEKSAFMYRQECVLSVSPIKFNGMWKFANN